jgi:hypothetical protein
MLVFEDDIKGDLIWMMTNIRKSGPTTQRRSLGIDDLQFDSLCLLMAQVAKSTLSFCFMGRLGQEKLPYAKASRRRSRFA